MSWFSPAARINRWLRHHERRAAIQCLFGLWYPPSYYEGMRDTYWMELKMLAGDPDPSFGKTGVQSSAFAGFLREHPKELGKDDSYTFGALVAETSLAEWCARRSKHYIGNTHIKREDPNL